MPSLSHADAVARSALLEVHSYLIELDLRDAASSTVFGSTVTITFTSREPGATTFVELKPAQLVEARLNGAPLDPASLVDNRLPVPDLAAENTLVVQAQMSYSNTGEGLHRFTDPEDGAVYLYGQSFLDDAQRIFACFDQPDLKARLTLRVEAPIGWEVAGNAGGAEVAPGQWQFEPTERLSTYLMSLIAGPWHAVRDSHEDVPLALYCRRGLAPHLDKDAEELFDIIRAALDYYRDLFGVAYPFDKFGQAFVPEFNAGAMENAGLVTFRDEFVYRSAVTDSEREVRANFMAHEIAHMWFGDLVTMRWWDDLWLNESFAEYMGHRTLVDATRFSEAWTDFAVARKGWGYAEDQRPSTHPVAPGELADSGLALLNFDGISYAKGAAILRQLAVFIGDDAFVAGLRAYFAAHAFGNATLADLLTAFSTASGRDLSEWSDLWLRRAQVNTLRPEVEVGPDGRYAAVSIGQTAPAAYPTLRPHRLGIGVYSGGTLATRVEVEVDGPRTEVPALVGVPAGDLLLLNDGDLTYAKIRFDPASQAGLPTTLPTITDPLARAVVWSAVRDAVRDGETSVHELVALCASALPVEGSLPVFRDVVRFVTTTAIDQYLPEDDQPAARATIATACRSALLAAEPGRGHQLLAARGFLTAAGPSDVDELWGWLRGTTAPAGLAIDAELRWMVLYRLCVLGAASEADIDAEYERDRTAAGTENAARCRAARPDPAAKAQAWRIIMTDGELSNRLVTATAEGFWRPRQAELTGQYVSRFFAEAPAMAARRSANMVIPVVEAAYPRFAVSAETVALSEALLADPQIPVTLRRPVADALDDLRRSLVARERSGVEHAGA